MAVFNDADREIKPGRKSWTEGLTGYHYLVLTVACFGWLFDTMDQWLYAQAKTPALAELLQLAPSDPIVQHAVGIAQSWMLIGWAVGGLFFGMIGDRLGRTKTMAVTILIYAVFTGLAAFAQTPFQFVALRFLTGLGIGGEFAAGASLVAETFPAYARTTALGLVQATSALGNVLAGFIYLMIGANPNLGWRWVFGVGFLPALLLFVLIAFIHEPQAWVESRDKAKAGGKKLGSIINLFQDRTLRRNTLVGVGLAAIGVIGFWGIGTWTPELAMSVVNPKNLAGLQSEAARKVSYGVMLWNGGGFFGVMAFAWLAQRAGRKMSFLVSLIMCAIVVPGTFYLTKSFLGVCLLYPIMGFTLLTLFGGFAIYFPELFPTRLRATGTGFCYNVARFIAAASPGLFGQLSGAYGMQRAALMLSSVFLLGIIFVLPFAPETKGKPLPE